MQSCASGARNVYSFQQATAVGRLPSPESVAVEGIFYGFNFETGEERERLFTPVFTTELSADPLSGTTEYFICMGMNGKLDGEGLERNGGRPNLNLVVVLDVSGSMECSFGEGDNVTKIDVARSSLVSGLLPPLRAEKDRLALVTFTEHSQVIQPMAALSSINLTELKQNISKLHAGGGTVLKVGMDAAKQQLLSNPIDSNENRIFYFTDMDPGTAPKECDELFAITEELAVKHNSFVTFVGLGVDFNSAVVDRIGKIKGCSYLSVKNSRDFKKMMDEEFKYFVTLSAQDVCVTLQQAEGWSVEEVFGSPGNEHPQNGVLCKISSSFPSPKPNAVETKGSVVVIKLTRANANVTAASELVVKSSYSDRHGKRYEETHRIALPAQPGSSGSAARKAVLLTRYAVFMKHLLTDAAKNSGFPTMSKASGIFSGNKLSVDQEAEQKTLASQPRTVLHASYKPVLGRFAEWFAAQCEEVRDPALADMQKSLEEVRNKGFEQPQQPHAHPQAVHGPGQRRFPMGG